jgi:hypothetical protein
MKDRLIRLKEAIRHLKGKGIIEKNQGIVNNMEYNKATLSNILGGKYSVSDNFIENFCSCFTVINKEWLLTGEGGMLKEKTESTKNNYPAPVFSFSEFKQRGYWDIEISKRQ